MFISLFSRTLLLEEVEGSVTEPLKWSLAEIRRLGPLVVEHLEETKAEYVIGKVYPLHKWHFPWRAKHVKLWRIKSLRHPLWLGEDGDIYRAYDSDEWSPIRSNPTHHWHRAEIELRHYNGRERVRRALSGLLPLLGAQWEQYPGVALPDKR